MSAVPPPLGDRDTDPTGAPAAAIARRSGLGPLVVVLIYTFAAAGLLRYAYVRSDAYRIGEDLKAGDQILGSDQGRSAGIPELEAAAGHYLDALSLDPDDRWAQHQLKSVRWRFQERSVDFPRALSLEAAAVGARVDRPTPGLFGQLPITPEARYPDALGAIRSAITYAAAGLAILLLWALVSFVRHRRELARLHRAMAERATDSTAMY